MLIVKAKASWNMGQYATIISLRETPNGEIISTALTFKVRSLSRPILMKV